MNLQLGCTFLALTCSQLPVIEADGVSAAVQKKALLATVRLINQKKNLFGVGVIVHRKGSIAYVLTAGHLVEDASEVELHVFDAENFPKGTVFKSAKVLARAADKQPDLAVVRLAGYEGESPGLKLRPLKPALKKQAFPAISIGCSKTLAPKIQAETVRDAVRAKKPGDARAGYYFRTNKKVEQGHSGGPLVDGNGQLIGICSGVSGEFSYYCHLEEIDAFLRDSGLSKRWQTESAAPPSK